MPQALTVYSQGRKANGVRWQYAKASGLTVPGAGTLEINAFKNIGGIATPRQADLFYPRLVSGIISYDQPNAASLFIGQLIAYSQAGTNTGVWGLWQDTAGVLNNQWIKFGFGQVPGQCYAYQTIRNSVLSPGSGAAGAAAFPNDDLRLRLVQGGAAAANVSTLELYMEE